MGIHVGFKNVSDHFAFALYTIICISFYFMLRPTQFLYRDDVFAVCIFGMNIPFTRISFDRSAQHNEPNVCHIITE